MKHRLGETTNGGFVVVDIELRERPGAGRETIRHDAAPDTYLELSITGERYEPGDRRGDPSSAGQCIDSLADVTTPAPGWTLDDIARLADIWQHWHLNGMRAACAHVAAVWETGPYGRPQPSLTLTPACPVSGYRYGHAWLIETLPGDVLAELRHLDRDRSADLYAARGYDSAGRDVRPPHQRVTADVERLDGVEQMRAWKVTLRYAGRRMTVRFYQGSAHTEAPTVADVLSCVVSDTLTAESAGSVEDFAADFGYDSAARSTRATYRALVEQSQKVRRLLGDDFDAVAYVNRGE